MFKEEILKTELEPEKEKEIETRIILHFMRHGKKEPEGTRPEYELRLSELGRSQADAKGRSLNPEARVAVGRGSPRKRTQETAYRVMLANENIPPDASLEEIEKIVEGGLKREGIKFGKKMVADERLNFISEGPLEKENDEAYNAGRYLPYIVLDSDRRVIETGDKQFSSYTRRAANIADLISEYAQMGKNFNRLVAGTDKYEKFGNKLERYLSTSQGIAESFVAKVLEKIQGVEKRDEFVKSVGGGFKETEGIHIELVNKGKEQNILVDYEVDGKKERVETDENLLNDIIEERKKFDENIQNLNASSSLP